MKIVDARGKLCPQPVIMTKKAVEKNHEKEIKVIVDNAIAGQNVSRFLKKKGFDVAIEAENIDILVTGILENAEEETAEGKTNENLSEKPETEDSSKKDIAILIARDIMGASDRELGEVLIKGFLGTIPELDDIIFPSTVAFMNEGVMLALKESSTCDHLIKMQERGCRILVCGTCVNHFGVTDRVGVGEISNMFDITEALLKSDKILSI